MKFFSYIAFMFILALFQGCGVSDSDLNSTNPDIPDINITDPIDTRLSLVFADGKDSTILTKNSEAYTIDIIALDKDNAPIQEGSIKVTYPEKIKDGIDIGNFSASEVKIVDGHAKFYYVGPQDIVDRVNNGDTQTTFGFYYTSTENEYVSAPAYFTFKYEPDTQQEQLIIKNYSLQWNKTSQETSIGLQSSTQLNFYIQDDKGIRVEDNKVLNFSISLLNPNLATIQDIYGNSGSSLSFQNQNNITVTFTTNTISGIVPILVKVDFLDANDEHQTLEKVYNMTILSGPPTAISISYIGTSKDFENAKFIEHMIVTVTDKYFNKVNTQPAISVSMVAGYAHDNNYQRIYRTTGGNTSLNPDKTFDTGIDLTQTDANADTDVLVTWGDGYTYNASGKWDIESINGSILNLKDEYDANKSTTGLGFAIGRNYRQDTCRDGKEWVGYADINSTNGNVLDFSGIAQVDIHYDYYLTGKDIILAVNIVGEDPNTGEITKIGESSKHTLRSTGFVADIVQIPANAQNYIVDIPISIAETAEYLRNSNIGYTIQLDDGIVIHSQQVLDGVGTCFRGGITTVELNVTNKYNMAQTVTVENIKIGNEF